MKRYLGTALLIAFYIIYKPGLSAQTVLPAPVIIPLYPGQIPNHTVSKDPAVKDPAPTLTVCLAPDTKPHNTAVIICPGGSYSWVSYQNEGLNFAAALNKLGITAFVLTYRLPPAETMPDQAIGPLQDAQQAIKVVRERAAEWHIDPHKIGIAGFSAGGHLAATASTHFNKSFIPNPQSTSLRPDFTILAYPVISFADSLTHMGSRTNLLGSKISALDQVKYFSNELQVNAQTPSTFLVHAGDDNIVDVNNSIVYYQALHKYKVIAALHIYPKGGHGFGVHNPTTGDEWLSRLANWLKDNYWIH